VYCGAARFSRQGLGAEVVTMNDRAALSVIVLNYRTPDRTARALQCLADAAPGIEIEAVAVDNGSGDGSPDSIRRSCPIAKVIELPENVGFAAGMNAGIRAATGDYLLLLNSDIEALPGSISQLIEFIRANPHVGLAAPLLIDEDGNPTRTLLDEAGLLDEDFFFYHEIVEWCMRIRDAGFRVVVVPAARMRHARGGSTGGLWLPAKIELKRSEYQLLEKRLGRAVRCWAIVRDGISESLRTAVYGLLSIGSARAREKLSVHAAVLRWLTMGMPDRRDKRYISRFGDWE
jgi:N-acetylglucosaminyl-diphospho-decaprenol L-rhamnosyltransferase